MKIHRFLYHFDDSRDEFSITDTKLINQLRNVLRYEKGNVITLFDGTGKEIDVELISVKKTKIVVQTIKRKEIVDVVSHETILFLSILKRENFELAVQKTTECGVTKIVPLICARTVKTGIKRDRLKKILIEASEQSGRATVPFLEESMNFFDALQYARKKNIGIIICEASGTPIATYEKRNKTIGIFVGPEGGWTEEEKEKARNFSASIVSFGRMTLRAETAAIIAVYEFSKK